MKHIVILLYITVLFVGCNFKDKSSFGDNPIPEIIIDTTNTGAKNLYVMNQYDSLIIKPRVFCDGVTDEDLDFEWRFLKIPEKWEEFDIVSTTKELRMKLSYPPSPKSYNVWFRVTNKKTNIMRDFVCQVEIKKISLQGLVVADTDDGQNTDFSLIQDSLFTSDFAYDSFNKKEGKQTIYMRNIFSESNDGRKIEGLLKGMYFIPHEDEKGITHYQIHAATSTNIFYFSSEEFKMKKEKYEMVIDPGFDFSKNNAFQMGFLGYGEYAPMVINNNKIFVRQTSDHFDPGKIYPFQGICVPCPDGLSREDYKANQHMSVIKKDYNRRYAFYDEYRGLFWEGDLPLTDRSPLSKVSYNNYNDKDLLPEDRNVYDPDRDPFDPNNVVGFKVLAGGKGGRGDHLFLLNKEDGYFLYSIKHGGFTPKPEGGWDQSPSTPRAFIDISEALKNIKDIISFAIPSNQSVIYFATKTKIYALAYEGKPLAREVYSCSEGEITSIKLVKTESARGGDKTMSYSDEKSLFIFTYSNGEGKIIVNPILNFGSGILETDEKKIKIFNGFNKIQDVVFQN